MGASGAAIFTSNLSKTLAFATSPAANPTGSNGIEHIVVLMMENRSFDHFLSWLQGANGVNDLTFPAYNGFTYPNYPLAPDYQGCGYSDPDHSWEGWLLQSNGGLNNGFLLDPTTPAGIPGVTRAAANTFPVGYYTESDLPVIGALAQQYLTLDNYFCAFAGETYPNRFYQHCGQTDRDHNSLTASTLPSIWDQLSPVPGTGQPWGGYFYRDSPFLALWYTGAITAGDFKYVEFFHAFADTDPAPIVYPGNMSFLDACAAGPAGGKLPNVCFVDPAFENGTVGTGGDDHPNSDVRLGERFIADAYHALADNGWLDNTVLIVTFDERAGSTTPSPPRRWPTTPPRPTSTTVATRAPWTASRSPTHPARFPGPGHRRRQPPCARPGLARGPVPALLDPGAHREHLRAELPDGQGCERQQPGAAPPQYPGLHPGQPDLYPDKLPGDGPGHQRSVRDGDTNHRRNRELRPGGYLQRHQHPVSLARGDRPQPCTTGVPDHGLGSRGRGHGWDARPQPALPQG
jgi:phospholipase C